MKKVLPLIVLQLCCIILNVHAQDAWVQKQSLGSGYERNDAVSFAIGNKGYVGPNESAVDFWEYDPVSDQWTQKADYPDNDASSGAGFSIGNKGYICGVHSSFWEYDPSLNQWIQKASIGAIGKEDGIGFSIGGKGYVGVGYSNDFDLNSFWEYDPQTDTWTRKANFPGWERYSAVGMSIGNKGYVGLGIAYSYEHFAINDFWEYDPQTDVWIQKSNFPGQSLSDVVSFSIGNKGYIGIGNVGGEQVDGVTDDFWEYNPSTDRWRQKATFKGNKRTGAVGLAIGNKGYAGYGGSDNDWWEYDPQKDYDSLVTIPVISDNTWKVITTFYDGWEKTGYNDDAWEYAASPSPGDYVHCSYTYNTMWSHTYWGPGYDTTVYLRKKIYVPGEIQSIDYDKVSFGYGIADVYINDTLVMHVANCDDGYGSLKAALEKYLHKGNNTIAMKVHTCGGCFSVYMNFGVVYTNKEGKNIFIRIYNQRRTEPSWRTTTMPFYISLSHPAVNEVSVNYVTEDNTAKANEDYEPASGTVTFAPGEKLKNLKVVVRGDIKQEPTEDFYVKLSDPVNATLKNTYAIGTIIDNDQGRNFTDDDENDIAVSNVLAGKSVKLSPNPASGKANIFLVGYSGNVTIHLSDMQGKLLQERKVQVLAESSTETINISRYANGIYQVMVFDEKGNRQMARLVIQQ